MLALLPFVLPLCASLRTSCAASYAGLSRRRRAFWSPSNASSKERASREVVASQRVSGAPSHAAFDISQLTSYEVVLLIVEVYLVDAERLVANMEGCCAHSGLPDIAVDVSNRYLHQTLVGLGVGYRSGLA